MFTEGLRDEFSRFKKPYDIQAYLLSLDYNPSERCNSPAKVIAARKAHCFEGALLAAAALRFMGHKPLVVDLVAHNDDDHVIAVFKQKGCFGAIAKSNTTLLRFREPVYKSLRELIMSYFDLYFNTKGEKTLRSYTSPLNLTIFDESDWMSTDENLQFIGDHLYYMKHTPIVKSGQGLSLAEPDLMKACFLGSVEEGLYKPN